MAAAVEQLRGVGPVTLSLRTDKLAREYPFGIEPQFSVDASDPDDPALVLCDRYWGLRLLADPRIEVAADCAGWVAEHVVTGRREVVEKWGLGHGFVTRDHVEPAQQVADAETDILAMTDRLGALHAALFHAGKLRANFDGWTLHQFLESSRLVARAGHDDPVITALRCFAAFVDPRFTTAYALTEFETAWTAWIDGAAGRATVDIALNGLARADRFDGQAELLAERAQIVLGRYRDDHIFHARLAQGLHLLGDPVRALLHIDEALKLLPAHGWRTSHDLLHQQYILLRDTITLTHRH
ncbi:hypothetical protein ACIP5Y_07595 [Nocardia sp. NPDC088792]|uniref:hypothetical protein n=1 Tax=Nocardia sp. NPDC088792 TaxID=3364332 RepID=UPI0038110C03